MFVHIVSYIQIFFYYTTSLETKLYLEFSPQKSTHLT